MAALVLAFTFGAIVTWRKWPDLVVDFGLQLYIPWRLSEGAVLYRDLFYMAGGPLSQYWHALLFALFGPSFLVIIISNVACTGAMLWIIRREFSLVAGPLCGFVTTLAVVCIFCFGQYTGVGNANYAAPYAHEYLHGVCLSIAALALMLAWLERKQILPIAGAGLCLGLVALTKPEIFFALALAILLAFFLARKFGAAFLWQSVAAFCAAAATPLLAFFLFFLRVANWQESLRLEFFGWRPLFLSSVVGDTYYQWCLGMDDPLGHLRTTALQTLAATITIGICACVARKAKSLPQRPRRLVLAILVSLLVMAAWRFEWTESGAALPVVCVITIVLLWQERRAEPASAATGFLLIWSVFALFLMAKQGFFPRLWQTGFALAMPAFVCGIFLLGWELPRFLEKKFSVPARSMRLCARATQ